MITSAGKKDPHHGAGLQSVLMKNKSKKERRNTRDSHRPKEGCEKEEKEPGHGVRRERQAPGRP